MHFSGILLAICMIISQGTYLLMPQLMCTKRGMTHLLARTKHLHVYSAYHTFLMYSTKNRVQNFWVSCKNTSTIVNLNVSCTVCRNTVFDKGTVMVVLGKAYRFWRCVNFKCYFWVNPINIYLILMINHKWEGNSIRWKMKTIRLKQHEM